MNSCAFIQFIDHIHVDFISFIYKKCRTPEFTIDTTSNSLLTFRY
ncbi:MAG: heme NO-binding domain-containing protein [Saprospiraceae bacterium]|nr:heme NO-binding domain-containing protein [Saprospiraceae bacterium]